MNRLAWLALTASFAIAFVASSVVVSLAKGGVESLSEVLVIAALSTLLFGLCSVGILFRHRPIAMRWVVTTGSAFGVIAYAATWGLWAATTPSFRHAVPFELVPILLAIVFGFFGGIAFYLASIDS